MEQTSIYLLMVQKSINLIQKTLASSFCLENISKDFSGDNMKKTGLKGYVYDFSVDYDVSAFDDNNSFQLQCIKCKFVRICFKE